MIDIIASVAYFYLQQERENMTTTILSLGGGVDSTALLAIDLHRDEAADLLGLDRADLDRLYPKLDQVVFSDTGAEFDETYDNIALARKKCMAAGLPFTTFAFTSRVTIWPSSSTMYMPPMSAMLSGDRAWG